MTARSPNAYAQNAHNPVEYGWARGSGDFVDDFARVKILLNELRALDVLLWPQDDKVGFDAPDGVLTHDLLKRIRADRRGLLEVLRAEVPVVETDPENHGDPEGDPEHHGDPVPTALRCPWCGPLKLVHDRRGLVCPLCRRLAWLDVPERGLIRADFVDADPEPVDPDEVPVCSSCGQWRDVVTLDGAWRCSKCDPEADRRRQRTLRVIGLVNRSRR